METIKALNSVLRQQVFRITLLSIWTVLLFLFTRAAAEHNREHGILRARASYGTALAQLKSGATDSAIDSLRQAVSEDRKNTQYSLTLAESLASADQLDEAERVLLQLREARTESGEINLDLARLAAKRGEIPEAKRYFHNALYGVWPDGGPADDRRRSVRFELARFLLDRRDLAGALSELLILGSDPSANSAEQIQIGRMFLEANEPQRALDQFTAILKQAPKNATALAGSGEAEYRLGHFARAGRYLAAASAGGGRSPEIQTLWARADLAAATDPLAPGIGGAERQRRALQILQRATERLSVCVEAAPPNLGEVSALGAETVGLESTLRSAKPMGDPEIVQSILDLSRRAEAVIPTDCGAPNEFDLAVSAVAGSHGDER